ncbi:hypothetical protein [Nocardia testacea]|uniref:hypothetical protein n=1 Tax=Nocardia testacea TaxID=248551 RepID=UPI0002E0A8E0|nr:hypothetical protein [Nocardia testacea]
MDLNAAYLDPATFPYDKVIACYRAVGKHFVPESLLHELHHLRILLRAVRGPATTELRRFLDIALDKWDGTYDYTTYLALPLLPLPDAEVIDLDLSGLSRAHARRDRLLLLLIADLIAFELDAAAERTMQLPGLRPSPALIEKRCGLAFRAALPAIRRRRLVNDDRALEPAHLPGLASLMADDNDRRMLSTTMLPVYTFHDEYLFIRVLQSYESTFALMAMYLRAAIFATATNRLATAAACIQWANHALSDSRALFSLVGTMQAAAFHEFRKFTEGASAIQSHNYKIVESLCREPDPARLNSISYESVPEVKHQVQAGHISLEEALFTARRERAVDPGLEHRLVESMAALSAEVQRWRRTHYSLARRMLGERPGSGFTEGTAYLAHAHAIPLFKTTGDLSP